MTTLYFVFSPAAAAAPIMMANTGDRFAVHPIQNTIKVCDARDGSVVTATYVSRDETLL